MSVATFAAQAFGFLCRQLAENTFDVLRIFFYAEGVIRSYRDRKTSRLASGERVPAFESFRHQAEKRLRILEAAQRLQDLTQLPSNHLEALTGDRKGQYSIRINMQWRICFEWPDGAEGPENVEIVDYH